MLREKTSVAFILCSLLFAGCATTQQAKSDAAPATESDAAAPASITTQYIMGETIQTSPDGATPFGPPIQVRAMRKLNTAEGTILERSWHQGKHYTSQLTRQASTNVFDISNGENTFNGTLTFASEDWAKASVTYDVKMSDGSGTLTGTGTWEGDTYTTNKVFSDPTGTPQVRIRDNLKLVTKEAFEAAAATQ